MTTFKEIYVPLNLNPLEGYRLRDRAAFQLHCRQPSALVASVRTEGNGLVVHRANCIFLQNTITLNDTNLTDWRKYGMYVETFPAFQALAQDSDVQLFFTCPSSGCRNLRKALGIP